MRYPQVWSNGAVRALPVGHLLDATLRNVAVGRSVALRAGPWVEVREDDSRLLRVTAAAPILAVPLTATPATGPVERPAESVAAELLFDAHPLSRSTNASVAHPPTCATGRGPRSRRAWPRVLTKGAPTADAADAPRTERAS